MKSPKLWLDSVGRTIEVGQVLTKAVRSGNSVSMRVGIVRDLNDACIEMDYWSYANKRLAFGIIRQSYQATVTGMSEADLLCILQQKNDPPSLPLIDVI